MDIGLRGKLDGLFERAVRRLYKRLVVNDYVDAFGEERVMDGLEEREFPDPFVREECDAVEPGRPTWRRYRPCATRQGHTSRG